MPRYSVTDPKSGKTAVLEGDSPPTESELADVFKALGPQSQATQPKPTLADYIAASVAYEGEQYNAPPIDIPVVGKPGTLLRGVSKGVSGLVHGATTGEGVALGAALMTPVVGEVVAPVMAGAMIEQAGEKVAEAAKTGSMEPLGEALVVGGAGALGARAALKSIRSPIPETEAAVREPISKPELKTPPEGAQNATQERPITENVLGKRAGNDEGGTSTETGGGGSLRDETQVPQEAALEDLSQTPAAGGGENVAASGLMSEGPGAASAVDFPTEPSAFSKATEAILSPLRKTRDAIKNVWQNQEPREEMVVAKDSLDNQAKLAGREAANDIRGDIRRTFDKDASLAEDALSFVVESKGDYDALDAMREKLIESDRADLAWRKRAVDAIDFAKYRWEELRTSARAYEEATNAQLSDENAAGIDTLKRPGYVMHAQDVDESVLGGGGEPSSFKKVRTFDTFADSIAAGIDPKSINAVDLLQSRVSAGQQMLNNRAWVEGLRDLKAADGTSIATDMETVKRADGSTYQQAPNGYHAESVGRTPIAVRDGFEGLFHALTDPSAWSRTLTGRVAMRGATASKSAVLAFDTFHLGRVAFWDSLIKSLGIKTFKAPFPSYKKGVTILDTSLPEIQKMADAGEIPSKWMPEITEAKRRLDLAVKTGYNVGRISDALYSDWVHSIPMIGKFNKFLFDQFQRGAMAESWLLEFERLRRARPDMPEVDAARKITEDLNTRFGNLGRQGLFKSRTAQDTARAMFLAPQWNEGLIRSELGAIKQAGEFMLDTARGKRIYAGTLLRSVGGMIVAQFAANQLVNYATRGKPTWENPEEGIGAKMSAWIPDLIGKGPGFFLNPLGLAAETTHLLLSAYERTGDFQKTLLQYARSRASVAMRPVLTFITNSDFLGRTLKPGTVWGEMTKEAVPVPIGGGAIASAAKQVATGKESETFPGQIQKQVMASFGVKTDQAPNANSRMAQLAEKFLKEHNAERPKWQGAPGDYSDLTAQLKVGNEAKARQLMDDLLEKKRAAEISDHFRDYPRTTFTGKRSLEGAFFKSLNPEQQATYKQATKDRADIANRAMVILREELAKKRAQELKKP